MAIVFPKPLFMRDSQMTVGVDDYAAAVSSVLLDPKTTMVSTKGLKPAAEFKEYDTDWTLDFTYIQDWESATSLSRKLWSARGTVLTGCTFKPITTGGAKFTVDLFIVPSAIGGATRGHASASVSLGVIGEPVFDYQLPATP